MLPMPLPLCQVMTWMVLWWEVLFFPMMIVPWKWIADQVERPFRELMARFEIWYFALRAVWRYPTLPFACLILGWPYLIRWAREIMLVFGALFHFGILLTMEIGFFAPYMLCLYLPLLPWEWWIGRKREQEQPDEIGRERERSPEEMQEEVETPLQCPRYARNAGEIWISAGVLSFFVLGLAFGVCLLVTLGALLSGVSVKVVATEWLVSILWLSPNIVLSIALVVTGKRIILGRLQGTTLVAWASIVLGLLFGALLVGWLATRVEYSELICGLAGFAMWRFLAMLIAGVNALMARYDYAAWREAQQDKSADDQMAAM
jgi:hypothetical protein